MASITAPGRLGDPEMSLATDPRVHPKVLEALKGYNLHELSYLTSDLGPGAPLDAIRTFVRNNEASLEELYSRLDYTLPGDPTSSTLVTRSETFIPGPDGNRLRLITYRPTQSRDTPLPAVIYFHGGGMIILSTDSPMHTSWAEALARSGLVVIAVDFRNALTPDGLTPFPAGLNDCAAAVRWVYQRREQLRISKIVLNAYGMPLEWRLRELPSLVECDGYLISCGTSALNAKLYDPSGEHARDPLAWPYWLWMKT
ncbi:hypothetical protein DL771_008814 [Monosporascus sp. 5C6A]|nr:hypothetical protein DL771_008814 [Monosporascus sp. 5C6A]